MTTTFSSKQVQDAFDRFSPGARSGSLKLRELIFECAADSEDVGPITEALRWGQPAYLTKTGSTLRLGVPKTGGFAIYAHCQTTIINDFAQLFPGDFDIEGNRAVRFSVTTEIDSDKLRFLIKHALTYKLNRSTP